MRRLLTTTIAGLALAAPLLTSVAASAQAPSPLEIKPGKLARGADISAPTSMARPSSTAPSGSSWTSSGCCSTASGTNAYIAALGNAQWGNVTARAGRQERQGEGAARGIDPFNTVLDAEADQIAYSFGDATSVATLEVYDLGIKGAVAARAPSRRYRPCSSSTRGSPSPRSSDFKVRTFTWNTVADDVSC